MTMIRTDHIHDDCRGTNARCTSARKRGMFVHIVPGWSADTQSIILPTYHFTTADEATAALELARRTAPLVMCDADLYYFRAQAWAYKLPIGWIDPARR